MQATHPGTSPAQETTDPQPTPAPEVLPFADPTPLGLISLAIACAALLPLAFGAATSRSALETGAVFCLLFGCGGQFLAGVINLANKNLLGGTVFSAFAFNWAVNAWVLWSFARGNPPDHQVLLATEAASLVLFLPLTYAFGFHSKILFAFLLDIDVLYALKLARGYGHVTGLETSIALTTLALGALALYIALAMLVNPSAGRAVFPVPGPLFSVRPAASPAPSVTTASAQSAIA